MAKKLGTPGPTAKKRNSGDTKGYADENPGRHDPQAGKSAKQARSGEDVAKGKRKR
jgi:hypothetical protein